MRGKWYALLLWMGLPFIQSCQGPERSIMPANKTPPEVAPDDPNTYVPVGAGLTGGRCPQGMMPEFSYQPFEVKQNDAGVYQVHWQGKRDDEFILALLVTTPDAILPRRPNEFVKNGRSFWVVQSARFPRVRIGPAPLEYGKLPSQSEDVTAYHSAFIPESAPYPLESLREGVCLKFSIVTKDRINGVKISSYLLESGRPQLSCQPDESLVDGVCVKKARCGEDEVLVNGVCQEVINEINCAKKGLVFIENQCRAPDYSTQQGKILDGNRCASLPEPTTLGAHCRFTSFGSLSACLDYRGQDWGEPKALALCQSQHQAKDQYQVRLEPGGCPLELFNSLCQARIKDADPKAVLGKPELAGMSWSGEELAYLFAQDLPDWLCPYYYKGPYSKIEPDQGWDSTDWPPLDDFLNGETNQ